MSIVNSNQLQNSITPANLSDCIEAIKVLNDNLEKLRAYGYGRDETSIKVLSEITTNNYVLNRLEKGTTALVKVNNSSTAKTVKLPVTTDTVAGDSYLFYDARNIASTNNITVDLNGCELDGDTTNPVINTDKGLLWLVCYEQGKFFTMSLGGGNASNETNLQKISETLNIDFVSTTDVTLFTVPTGKTLVITNAFIIPTTINTLTTEAEISIGKNATAYDDIYQNIPLTSLDSTSKFWQFNNLSSPCLLCVASDVIKVKFNVNATATAFTGKILLYGFYL